MGDFRGVMVSQNYVQILVSLLSPDIKQSSTLAKAVKKIDFWVSIWGFRGIGTLKLYQNIFVS